MEEELEFAEHPLLGLANHLHQLHGSAMDSEEWQVALNGRDVTLKSSWEDDEGLRTSMSQGKPVHLKTLSHDEAAGIYEALSLSPEAGLPHPAEVITTRSAAGPAAVYTFYSALKAIA